MSASLIALLAGAAMAAPGVGTGTGNGAGKPPASQQSKAQPKSKSGSAKGADSKAKPAAVQDEAAQGDDSPQVKVDDNLVVDLHVNDEELTNVLTMLSIQSQRNIIPTKSVNGRISANLYGVTFYEALDSILNPNGFGYIERNNRIEVYTLDELLKIEQQSRVRIAKVIKLNFLNAIDAAEFVKPLLSEGAQIKTNGKTADFSIPENTPVGKDEYAHESAMVVYDYEENVKEIERLVKELDTRPAQVLVEATILQTALNEVNAFGVDFALIGDLNFNDFSGIGGPLKAADSLVSGKGGDISGGSSSAIAVPGDGEGRALVSSPGNTGGPATLKVGIVDNDVSVFLRLLDEATDTTIISNPKILTLNRQPARVLVGRKVGYLNTTSTDTTTTQTVEFLDTGTQLYFRPFVTSEGLIRMELKPQVSEAVIRDAKDTSGATVTIPDEVTNELVTNVMVRDGQTVVLGGLFRESTEATRRQVPFLGDIPLIGSAFRGNDDETQRNEIIFLITPTIVNDQVLVAQGERGKSMIESVRTGTREGLLPWSRDKMTSSMLVEADKLAKEGQTEKALWLVQRSLELNHNQPDAIQLREKLTSSKSAWPHRSVLEDVVDDEAKGAAHDAAKATSAAPSAGLDHLAGTQGSDAGEHEAAPSSQAESAPGATLTGDTEVATGSETNGSPSDLAAAVPTIALDGSVTSQLAEADSAEPAGASSDSSATSMVGGDGATAAPQVADATGGGASAGPSDGEVMPTATVASVESAGASTVNNAVVTPEAGLAATGTTTATGTVETKPRYIAAWSRFLRIFIPTSPLDASTTQAITTATEQAEEPGK